MNLIKKLFKDKMNREISSNILLTFLIKGGAMIISVLIVPAYTSYFSNDDIYGAWLTISSVFIWMNMFDFGIGNGLRNFLVKSIAEKDDESSKKYISSSYISVGILSLFILIVGLTVICILDWNSLMKVSSDTISPTIFKVFISVVFSGVVIHFFFLLITSISYALQKTFLPGLISLITQIIILVYLLIPNSLLLEERVISLSVVYFLAYNIPILAATVIMFAGVLKKVKPSFKAFDKSATRQVMSLGGAFFVIQIALIALHSSNEIYINSFFAPSDVVQYNYYHKLFYLLMVFITLVLQPFWSAVTKAFHEKRYQWIKKTYVLLNGIGLLLCFSSVILALIYQPISNIWLGKGVLRVDGFTVALFSVYTSMYVMSNIANSFSNGLTKLKFQRGCTVLGAVLKLAIVVIVVAFVEGVSWNIIMLANVVAMFPLTIAHPLYIYKEINKLIRSQTYEEADNIKYNKEI